jgi:hypothetical protein
MNTIDLRRLAAETRLAQLDLNAARRAAEVGQATDREVSMAEAGRDSALEFYEEAEALADEATPLFSPRPWLTDPYLLAVADLAEATWAAREADVSRETLVGLAEDLQLDPWPTEAELEWAHEILNEG